MKPGFLAVLVCAILSLGAAAPKSDNTMQRVESAVKSAVSAYVAKTMKTMGSADVRVSGATVTSINTRPLTGWEGRYESSGSVDLTLTGKSVAKESRKQARSFSASVTVENGSVQVTDVRVN